MSRRKNNLPALKRPLRLSTYEAAVANAAPGDGIGLVVTNELRAEVGDDVLRAAIAAGAALFDTLGRELYFNARGDLIPVDPDFAPGIARRPV